MYTFVYIGSQWYKNKFIQKTTFYDILKNTFFFGNAQVNITFLAQNSWSSFTPARYLHLRTLVTDLISGLTLKVLGV